MNLLRTGLLSGVATGAKLISGFLVLKVIAIYSGPEGVAQFGQFMSLAMLLIVFAGGGIASGIVKYLAEYRSQQDKVTELLNVGVTYVLFCSLLMCFLVLLFRKQISAWMFGNGTYIDLIVLLAFAQIFVALHNFIIAITNGMMDVRRIAIIQVIGAGAGLVVTVILAYYLKLYGALLAYIIGQGVLVFVSFFFFKQSNYFNWRYLRPGFNKYFVSNLSRFSLMTLTSALLGPIVQIIARNIMADRLSWEKVGYWQAVTKVSEAYLLFITTAISVYYLPKLSSLVSKNDLRNEIVSGYRFLIPFAVLSAASIFMFKDTVTLILFSDKFTEANDLYAPQLVGDVIKVASFVLSYLMLAKAMTFLFVFSEICFSFSYLILLAFMVEQHGVIGAMYAFIANYCLYLLFNVIVVRRYLRKLS